MNRSKLLCLDGTSPSGGFGYISAGLLAELQARVTAKQPGLGILDDVAAFVGTSAGSWNALYLASHTDPSAALTDIVDFWQQLNGALAKTVSLRGGVGAISGASALLNSSALRDFLIDYFGSSTTLGDLPHPVMITSFQLDTPDQPIRNWRARVFDTFSPSSTDADELVVDVALRSSAAPVLLPIYGSMTNEGPGFVDGGVFANNPSLVAYTNMLNHRSLGRADFQEALVLSFGNGVVPKHLSPRMCKGMASWGYALWMLDVCKPLVAIDLMIEASMSLTTFQCEQLLRQAYHRIDPFLGEGIITSVVVANAIEKLIAEPTTKLQLDGTLEWMSQSGWLEPA
ncbi:patatin-like phospholipase family protein [Nannocystaceae bacterium ST9]